MASLAVENTFPESRGISMVSYGSGGRGESFEVAAGTDAGF